MKNIFLNQSLLGEPLIQNEDDVKKMQFDLHFILL